MTSTLHAQALLLGVALLGLSLSACENTETPDEPDTPVIRELRLLQAFPDRSEQGPFAGPQPTLHDALTQIWDATANQNVKGLLVRVGTLEGSWGSVGDLVEALNEFRSKSRPIHCHFEAADNVGYLLLTSPATGSR